MMPKDRIRDPMRNTMTNLRFVEEHAESDGLYEVTQLINSFLAALAHPWEEYKDQLNEMSIQEAVKEGWPKLKKERASDKNPKNLGDLIKLVRNGFAHGNIEFRSDGGNEITHLRFWNIDPYAKPKKRTWGTIASVEDMRLFLFKFVELAETLTDEDVESRRTA